MDSLIPNTRPLAALFALSVAFAFGSPSGAYAQSCGSTDSPSSDSDSSSDSSSGPDYSSSSDDYSSDDYSSDDDSSNASPSRCANDSQVVGVSECRRFGRWDVSQRRAWSIGLDVGALWLNLGDAALEGGATHDNLQHAWSARDLDAGPGIRVAGRLSTYLHPNVFVGAEGAIGGGSVDANVTSGTDTTLDSVLAVEGAVFVGGSLGIGDLRLNLDLATGRRRMMFSGSSQLGDCVTGISDTLAQWTLRGRASVQYFLFPNVAMTLSAQYGFLQRDLSASLGVSIHTRAFDAR